jgi:hypothetical protein
MWPVNSALNSDILQADFFESVERAEKARFYGRLSTQKTVTEITNTFPSFGSVPEIRQLSGISGGGTRQPVLLKDWSMTATVFEWEQTVPITRLIAESKSEAVRAKTQQIATKAMKGMDRVFCQALNSTTALGYDGVAITSTAHPESGTSQSNLVTGANITLPAMTAAEAEAALLAAIPAIKAFVDDQGTPVNEGISRFIVLCPLTFEIAMKLVVDPTLSNQAIDSSGITGRFRGQVEVIGSAYATATGLPGGTVDRFWVFPVDDFGGSGAVALTTLADWQFNSNIGNDNSDDWNNGMGYLRSWAAFVFAPWNWHSVMCHILT